MHIVGTAVDSLGNSYYKVKNSWGERAGRHGYWYASPAYVAGKTIECSTTPAPLWVSIQAMTPSVSNGREPPNLPHRGETM